MMSKRAEIALGVAGGLLIPVILFAITPLWSTLFKETKELQYKVVSRSEVGGPAVRGSWPELKINYKGQELEKGMFLFLQVANTGDVPIRTGDYERPLRLQLNRRGVVLGYRKVSATPRDLTVQAVLTDSVLEVAPLLLNPGDQFIIELFGRDTFNVVGGSARIVGVTAVSKIEEQRESGIFLVSIEDLGLGRSAQTRLLRIPLLFLIVLTVLGFTFASVMLFESQRWVHLAVGAFMVAIAGSASIAALIDIARTNASGWVVLPLFVVMYLLSMFLGFMISRGQKRIS